MSLLLTRLTSCFCLLILAGLPPVLQAQAGTIVKLERLVVASGGGTGTADSLNVMFTLGEPATTTAVTLGGQLVLTMGFHQADRELVSIEQPEPVTVDYQVFPNPTRGLLSLQLTSDVPVTLLVDVLDAQGRRTTVPTQRLGFVGNNETILNLSALADGMYLLQIREVEGKTLQTLKIQKIQ